MSSASVWRPILGGPLLLLCPLEESNWAALRQTASDPAIWVGHPIPDRWKEAILRSFFEEILSKEGAMGVFDRRAGDLVGASTFYNYKPQRSQIEIGYTFLARSHWGGTYNREMKRLMLTHAFQIVDRVTFRIAETNLRSRRACEKIGGRFTGHTEFIDGPKGPIAHLVYEIFKEDFDCGEATSVCGETP